MKDRIKIDGQWYVKQEEATDMHYDLTYSKSCTTGKFTYGVLLDDDGVSFALDGPGWVEILDNPIPLWDNPSWLENFRDETHTGDSGLSPEDEDELRYLLKVVTKKGWL